MKKRKRKTCVKTESCRNLQFSFLPLTLACVKQRLPQLKLPVWTLTAEWGKTSITPLPPLRDDGVKLAETAAASGKFEVELRRLTDCLLWILHDRYRRSALGLEKGSGSTVPTSLRRTSGSHRGSERWDHPRLHSTSVPAPTS